MSTTINSGLVDTPLLIGNIESLPSSVRVSSPVGHITEDLPTWVVDVSSYWIGVHLVDWRRTNAFYLYLSGLSVVEAASATNIRPPQLRSIIRTTKVYTHRVPWDKVRAVFLILYRVLRKHPSIIEVAEGEDPFGRVRRVRYCVLDDTIVKGFKGGYEHVRAHHDNLIKKLITTAFSPAQTNVLTQNLST